jgi:hypothetical protein
VTKTVQEMERELGRLRDRYQRLYAESHRSVPPLGVQEQLASTRAEAIALRDKLKAMRAQGGLF